MRCNLFLLTATFPLLKHSSRISKMLDEAQFSCHYLWPLNSQQLLFFSIFNVPRLWLRIEWTEWWNVSDSCHRLLPPPLPTLHQPSKTEREWAALSSVKKVKQFFFKHTTHWPRICVSKTSEHLTTVWMASISSVKLVFPTKEITWCDDRCGIVFFFNFTPENVSATLFFSRNVLNTKFWTLDTPTSGRLPTDWRMS